MITLLKNVGLGLILTAVGLTTLSSKGFAYNFHYSLEESEIFNTDFNNANGWLLNGTAINSGVIHEIQ